MSNLCPEQEEKFRVFSVEVMGAWRDRAAHWESGDLDLSLFLLKGNLRGLFEGNGRWSEAYHPRAAWWISLAFVIQMMLIWSMVFVLWGGNYFAIFSALALTVGLTGFSIFLTLKMPSIWQQVPEKFWLSLLGWKGSLEEEALSKFVEEVSCWRPASPDFASNVLQQYGVYLKNGRKSFDSILEEDAKKFGFYTHKSMCWIEKNINAH